MSGTFATPSVPNVSDYTVFLRNWGITTQYLPDNSSWIQTTFNIAMDVVTETLNAVAPDIYTLAVYNLAADRLLNFAPDQTNQNYFTQKRASYNLLTSVPGIVGGASDQGTSVPLLNPDQMKQFTLLDLQTLKTPFGRTYMGFAQMYGQSLWGLS